MKYGFLLAVKILCKIIHSVKQQYTHTIKQLCKVVVWLIFVMVFSVKSFAMYDEYTLPELSQNIDTIYLRDALRYLTLANSEEKTIKQTLSGSSKVEYKLLTFPKENIRVLILYDKLSNEQTINIITLQNAMDLYRASSKYMQHIKFFTFKINKYYAQKYIGIREEILRNIRPGVVKINTLGSASVYGTLLAIEVSSMQLPIETLITFGATKFTTQEGHQSFSEIFSERMLALTHEDDASHKIKMPFGQAKMLPMQQIICNKHGCGEKTFELQHYSLKHLLNHFSNFPEEYAQIYHDSILKYHAK